jgi:hypothetical protein
MKFLKKNLSQEWNHMHVQFTILFCNELFAIGHSNVVIMFHEVIIIINVMFRKLITWPMDDR